MGRPRTVPQRAGLLFSADGPPSSSRDQPRTNRRRLQANRRRLRLEANRRRLDANRRRLEANRRRSRANRRQLDANRRRSRIHFHSSGSPLADPELAQTLTPDRARRHAFSESGTPPGSAPSPPHPLYLPPSPSAPTRVPGTASRFAPRAVRVGGRRARRVWAPGRAAPRGPPVRPRPAPGLHRLLPRRLHQDGGRGVSLDG